VLIHSSDRYPLGNCDWPGLETFPDYLTRLGTVSCLASLTAQLLLRVTDDARTPPEELVNPASAPNFYLQLTEGPRQPACLDLSPVAWAYPRNFGASQKKKHQKKKKKKKNKRNFFNFKKKKIKKKKKRIT
jgi:hypothetical protein